MIKKNYKEVKEEVVTKANSTKTTIRWLITKDDGALGYATRRFEIQPGGQVGIHSHPEDHHVYILHGKSQFIDGQGTILNVNDGDSIYIPPNEPHGIINNGTETLAFICIIPYL